MKRKLYFRDGEDTCKELPDIIDEMEEEGITELDVFRAVVERGTGYFFCTIIDECMDSSDKPCSKRSCSYYQPRNGKSGICKNYGYVYEYGKKETIRINPESKTCTCSVNDRDIIGDWCKTCEKPTK